MWEIVARNVARWDARISCFLDVCSMQLFLRHFSRDACKLHNFWHLFLFSASALTLGSPAGVGVDLISLFVWHYFYPIFLICSQFWIFLSDICGWQFFWHTSRHWFEIHIICEIFFRHIPKKTYFSEIHFDTCSYILPTVPAFFGTFFERGKWGGGGRGGWR